MFIFIVFPKVIWNRHITYQSTPIHCYGLFHNSRFLINDSPKVNRLLIDVNNY